MEGRGVTKGDASSIVPIAMVYTGATPETDGVPDVELMERVRQHALRGFKTLPKLTTDAMPFT